MIWIREPFLSARRDYGRLIVHGHTPLDGDAPDLRGNRLNLDTGAVFGGPLTAAVFSDAATPPFGVPSGGVSNRASAAIRRSLNICNICRILQWAGCGRRPAGAPRAMLLRDSRGGVLAMKNRAVKPHRKPISPSRPDGPSRRAPADDPAPPQSSRAAARDPRPCGLPPRSMRSRRNSKARARALPSSRPGRYRSAHRRAQPPRLRARAQALARLRQALRRQRGAALYRSRRIQAGERPPRPRRRRRRAQSHRGGAGSQRARLRRRGAARRRRIRRAVVERRRRPPRRPRPRRWKPPSMRRRSAGMLRPSSSAPRRASRCSVRSTRRPRCSRAPMRRCMRARASALVIPEAA